jgi:hypothetical protein
MRRELASLKFEIEDEDERTRLLKAQLFEMRRLKTASWRKTKRKRNSRLGSWVTHAGKRMSIPVSHRLKRK